MTRHEELAEEYIDAYFALLMEEVALEEGKRLERENEELRQDPNAAVPEELNQRCQRTIKQYFASQRRHRTLQTIKKIGYRVAVLIVVAGVLFTTAFAFSESFRMKVLTFEDHIRINLEISDTVEQEGVFHDVEVKWLPDGYNFTEQHRSPHRVWNKYRAANGQLIEVSVYMNSNVTMGLDSEDADMEQIEIQGNSALMLAKEGDVQIAWLDSKNGSLWEVYGENIPRSDVIQVAENVILK